MPSGWGWCGAGDLLDSLGTVESVFALTESAVLDEDTADTGYEQGRYVVPGGHYAMDAVYTSGAGIDWAARLLGLAGEHRHEELVTLAGSAPPGSDGVLFLPYLRLAGPPHNDSRARAAFVGMSDSTSRAEIARAVLGGLAYEFVLSLRGLEQRSTRGSRGSWPSAEGRGNDLGLAIKGDLVDRPIERATNPEPGALGAAMLAGCGAGVFASGGTHSCMTRSRLCITRSPNGRRDGAARVSPAPASQRIFLRNPLNGPRRSCVFVDDGDFRRPETALARVVGGNDRSE